MYVMKNEVAFTQCGADGKLKLSSAAALMMDACQFQEYQEVEFCRFLRENNIAVYLFSMQIDILRLPRFRENICTTVKIYGCKSIYGLRRITIHDESGSLCMIVNATGAFFDLNAGKALKLDPAVFKINFDPAEPMEMLPRKIPVPAVAGVDALPFYVNSSALDPNGHMTTPEYFRCAADALPHDFSYNRVRLEFKQQAKAGDVLIPRCFKRDENFRVIDIIGAEGESLAVAEFSTAELLPL